MGNRHRIVERTAGAVRAVCVRDGRLDVPRETGGPRVAPRGSA